MGSLERIDETDARILDLLQRDGRESYAEVGQAVGMSGPSAHERVKKLEARGVIRGYAALVDPTLLGYGVLAFIFIKQVPGTIATDMTGDFVEIDEIEECHHLAGEADYLLKVRATDTRHLERVLHEIQAGSARLHDRDPGRLLERVRAPAAPAGPRAAIRQPAPRNSAATPAIRARQLRLVSGTRPRPYRGERGEARRQRPRSAAQPHRQSGARAARGLDVRLDRPGLRPHEHDHDRGPGRPMAPGGRPSRPPRAGRLGAGRGLRHGQAHRALWPRPSGRTAASWAWISRRRCSTRPGAPAATWPESSSGAATPWPAGRGRDVRRGHDRLRAAQPGQLRGRLPRDGQGRPAGRTGGLPGAVRAAAQGLQGRVYTAVFGRMAPVRGHAFRPARRLRLPAAFAGGISRRRKRWPRRCAARGWQRDRPAAGSGRGGAARGQVR